MQIVDLVEHIFGWNCCGDLFASVIKGHACNRIKTNIEGKAK